MSKVVVRFAIRIRLQCVSDVPAAVLPDGTPALVEWKRGKHHGSFCATSLKLRVAVWDGQDFLLPCTLYFNVKKKAFEEKDLLLTVCKQPGQRAVGKCRVALATLALQLGDQVEKSFARKDVLDGVALGHLEYTVTVKRLVDPRDGRVTSPISSSSTSGSPAAMSSPAVPALSFAGVAPPASATTSPATATAVDVSPLLDAAIAPISIADARRQADRSRAASTSWGELPQAAVPRSPRGGGEEPRRSPRTLALAVEERDSSNSSPVSDGPPPSLTQSMGGYATAGGMPITAPVRGHSRLNSVVTPTTARIATATPDATADPKDGSNAASPARGKKSLLGGAGHRRGKSHAVTPDELKGLHAPADLRVLQVAQPSVGSLSSGKLVDATPRKSGPLIGGATAAKLFHKHGKRGSNASSSPSPSMPHAGAGGSATGGPGAGAGADTFLITGDSDSDEPLERSSNADVESWLAVDAVTTPHRGPARLSVADAGPATPSEDDAAYRKRQSAEMARRRDETFVFHTFVAFCEPAYSSELSVSAYVLFRCLVEWDSFRPDEGRSFREQLQEGFEKLSKSVNDQPRAIYWLSTLVSLMYLLRNRLKPIPRSEVAKSNTLVVFQERLRGLTSVFFARVATLALADIKPLLVTAVLEQNSLEHLTPGPSSPKSGPAHRAGRGGAGAGPRATAADVVGKLDSLRAALIDCRVMSSIVSQLYARIAHGMVAHTLNTLLDNNPRLCTFSNGLQMKKPVSELKGWFHRRQFEAAAKNMSPLDEVINVLCMNKSVLAEPDVRKEVCPSLSPAQLSQLLVQYTPDDFDSEPVAPAILSSVSGALRQPYDFRMSEEMPAALSLDLTEASYTLAKVPLPAALQEHGALAFLALPEVAADADEW